MHTSSVVVCNTKLDEIKPGNMGLYVNDSGLYVNGWNLKAEAILASTVS
jgi:hypothetical protein